jgi:hypothetical protein
MAHEQNKLIPESVNNDRNVLEETINNLIDDFQKKHDGAIVRIDQLESSVRAALIVDRNKFKNK